MAEGEQDNSRVKKVSPMRNLRESSITHTEGRSILVLPLFYGDRQRRILLEENPNDASLLYYDEQFGGILKDVMFESGDFKQHLAQVNTHYDEVEKMLNNRYLVDTQ